jgi:hypothetical protein
MSAANWESGISHFPKSRGELSEHNISPGRDTVFAGGLQGKDRICAATNVFHPNLSLFVLFLCNWMVKKEGSGLEISLYFIPSGQ